MQKIKVLHIIKSLGRGGAEMLLPETLKLHDKNKFEFTYIYFLPWKDQMVELIRNNGGEVICFPSNNNIALIRQSENVIRFCRNNKINLIHCHLPWAGFLGRIVHLRTKIPTVYSEHSLQEQYHPITKVLNKYTYNYQNLAIGVSDGVRDSILSNVKPNINVTTLPNGVNTDAFRRNFEAGKLIRKKYGFPENSIVLGSIAVFRTPKRLIEWLRVFKKVVDKNKNVYGILVGAGPLEKEIKEELFNLNLEERLILPGLKTDVKPYLSALDIFMMSSAHEGLPVALLEAMSMECAVVSTDAGGIKEVIRNGQDGLICKVEEWQELSKLCQILIDDPDKLENYKKAGRERVVKNFSLKKMVDELEVIYNDLVTK